MRNIILLVFLFALFALPSFSAIKRAGDNYTEPEKPRHPFLKDTEIYYLTSDGERKEAEFDLYVLKTPIKECKKCVDKRKGYTWDNSLCDRKIKGYKYTSCYPKPLFARLTISKIFKRIDNCTITPIQFKRWTTKGKSVPAIKPVISGEYDKLKKAALLEMHNNLLSIAEIYSVTKLNKCGDYPDLRQSEYGTIYRVVPHYITE